MDKTLKNVKIWKDTLYAAKLLAAMLDISIVRLIHELVMSKLEEVKGRAEDGN